MMKMMMRVRERRKKRVRLRLTDKMINKLQNYFGIAVRACAGKTMEEMKRDIGAALYHCCQFDEGTCFVQRCLCHGVNTKLINIIIPAYINRSLEFAEKYLKKSSLYSWN